MFKTLRNLIRSLFAEDFIVPDKEPEPVQAFSEPVLSFLNCLRENPKRFTLHCKFWEKGGRTYTLRDRVTGESFQASEPSLRHGYPGRLYGWTFPDFLSREEFAEIVQVISASRDVRLRKKYTRAAMRRDRKVQIERDRLTAIYQKQREE
ncbi:hypothetical protein D3C85_374560 [compost metagenome]